MARDTWNRLQKYESFWDCVISGKRSISFRTTIPHPRLHPVYVQDILLLRIADTKVSLAKRYGAGRRNGPQGNGLKQFNQRKEFL